LNLGVTASSVKHTLRDFDEIVSSCLTPIFEAALFVGDVVEEQADLLYNLVSASRAFIVLLYTCKKPQDDNLLVKPIMDLIQELTDFADKNKGSKYYDVINIVSKGANAFGWIMSPSPVSYLQQIKTNLESVSRLLKESKLRSELFTIVDCYNNFIKYSEYYAQKHFASGIVWNAAGKDTPAKLTFETKSMLIRYYGGSTKIHTEGSKMYCEFITGEKSIDIEQDKKPSIFILSSSNASILIKGSTSSLTIEGCSYSKITISDPIPNIIIFNSQRIEFIAQAPISNINLERTSGCTLNLIDANADITVSGSSNLVLNLPDPIEIPTQLKSKIKQGKVHTVPTSNKS